MEKDYSEVAPATEVEIISSHAEVVKIITENHSYGIFCYNSLGDLFLSSDWGMYGFAWRSFGGDFPSFLAVINAYYAYDKFEMNYRYLTRKDLPKSVKPHVIALLDEFIKYMKSKHLDTSNQPQKAS